MISFPLPGGKLEFRTRLSFLALVLFFLGVFLSLMVWQVTRALLKEQQFEQLETDLSLPPLDYDASSPAAVNLNDLRSMRIRGRYLPYTMLLDNSIFVPTRAIREEEENACHWLLSCGELAGRARVGYRVITLFQEETSETVFAVERGWIEGNRVRTVLPHVASPPEDVVVLTGVPFENRGRRRVLRAEPLILPKNLLTASLPGEVVRLQNIDTRILQSSAAKIGLSSDVYPAVFILQPDSAGALPLRIALLNLAYLKPQRHWGYALQWFLMGLALVILYFWVSIEKRA